MESQQELSETSPQTHTHSKEEELKNMDFKLEIPDSVFQKIMWWINKSNHEVSGFGSLDFDAETKLFTVRDAILLKQEVAPTSTEIDPHAIGKAMYEMRAETNALKWHWHSHVNMGVFWSGDDKELIKNLGAQGWILATVLNKAKEMKTMFHGKSSISVEGVFSKTEEVFTDDIPTYVQRYIAADLCAQWDKDYEDHVQIEKPPSNVTIYDRWSWIGKDKPAQKGFVSGIVTRADAPTIYRSMDCNSYGWRYHHLNSRLVYNPIFDTRLKTVDEIIEKIYTMDDQEVEAAIMYHEDRESLFFEYYQLAKAKRKEEDSPDKLTNEESNLLAMWDYQDTQAQRYGLLTP